MTAKEYLQHRDSISKKTFSNRLNSALAKRNLSQKEAAEICNISPGSMWKYLHGRLPNAQALFSIAVNLNISVDWLLALEENESRKEDKYGQ